MSAPLQKLHWSLYFLVWTFGLTLAGALLGAAGFLVGGLALGAKFSPAELAMHGARNVGFVVFVWAMPIAIVTTVIRGYARRGIVGRRGSFDPGPHK
jgi:hypothetical protein